MLGWPSKQIGNSRINLNFQTVCFAVWVRHGYAMWLAVKKVEELMLERNLILFSFLSWYIVEVAAAAALVVSLFLVSSGLASIMIVFFVITRTTYLLAICTYSTESLSYV